MLELVMAIAWRKPIFLFRHGFRPCTDTSRYPLNLVPFTGLPRRGSEAYWYPSIGELADLHKALSQ